MTDRLNKQSILDACQAGDLERLQGFFSQGTDVHKFDDYALQQSCRFGHLHIAKWLFSQGADLHARGECAFFFACRNGHLVVAQWLTSQGANIHVDNDISFIDACGFGHLHMVQWLVNEGVDIHQRGVAAIREASFGGHQHILLWLISKGADIYSPNLILWITECVCSFGYVKIAEWLLNIGVDAFIKDKYLLQSASDSNFEMVRWMVNQGADINHASVLHKTRYQSEIRVSFLMGTHERVGANSSIHKWVNHCLAESCLCYVIFDIT